MSDSTSTQPVNAASAQSVAPVPAAASVEDPAPAPAEKLKPVIPQAGSSQSTEAHQARMSLVEGLRVSLQSKSNLQKKNVTQGEQLTTVQAQLSEVTAERDTLKAQYDELSGQLTALQTDFNAQVTQGATTQAHALLANVGQPMDSLPASASLTDTETVTAESLWEQAAKESDPVKKGELMEAASQLERKG